MKVVSERLPPVIQVRNAPNPAVGRPPEQVTPTVIVVSSNSVQVGPVSAVPPPPPPPPLLSQCVKLRIAVKSRGNKQTLQSLAIAE